MITTRELPEAEWDRLKSVEPFDKAGLPPANGHWRVLVAEDETNTIVGCVSLHTQVHFDPWWIAESQRANPNVVRGLIHSSVAILKDLSIDHVFATIDQTHKQTQAVAEHFGFERAPGQLYLLDLDHLKEF